MGYPTSWRRGRSGPRRLGRANPPAPYDHTLPAWMAGAAAAWWAGQNLQNAFDAAVSASGGYAGASRPSPALLGWTLLVNCNKPGAPRAPAANFASCAVGQLSSIAQWNTYYAANASLITEKKLNFINTAGTAANWDVARTWRWLAGGVPRNFTRAIYPGNARPVGALLGAVPVARPLETGYTTRPWEGPQPYGWPVRRPWGRWDVFIRNIHDETQAPARPAPITVTPPRAIPYPLTKEIKVNLNRPAGRAFVTMLMAWNFLGDTWGLTSALWRALPREARGSSRALGPMMRDLYRGWRHFNPYDEDNQHTLLLAFMNVSVWKFSDVVMGSAQSSLFEAQTAVAGATYARVWASLDSHGRAQTQSFVRTYEARGREENSYAR